MKITSSDATESVCPVCLKRIQAERVLVGDEVFQVKRCAEHGSFKTLIWRGEPSMAKWRRPKTPVHPDICYGTLDKGCPFDCGLCSDHRQLPCSVLLEVTDRCNLQCAVCFADAGPKCAEDPSLEQISWLLERALAAAGACSLQLSGGEPTLRDDLPEIVETARRIGFSFIQVNTNGLRLASDKDYAQRLRAAGLSSVFLQFDGVDDEIYRILRGKALLEQKLLAVRNAGEAGLGVVLVPTLVRGVNTEAVGAIVRQALQLAPVVRGIHFQPVSYFGRFPEQECGADRFTLPELMRCLEEQSGELLKVEDFSPPGGEHAHCSLHATYVYSANGGLRPLGAAGGDSCCATDCGSGGIRQTVDTVSRRWKLPPGAKLLNAPSSSGSGCCGGTGPEASRVEGPVDLDVFIKEVSARSFTISAMAFQDAENLDLERLRGCCISVISPDGRLVPFCAYNLTSREGKSLYRIKPGGGL
ncbi:radical SAM protein [Geoanaerobacter pelophilus]|uniref:Radical SAM protein n=1 Tax=Geoanaerobacter pelophilus TaxID=60036 RepID=A0ABQ0MKI9_9BACT|nr:radical SAM (seleno)protein TrsS [Geoanaerobacter pelophilus]GAW66691.1 radical SAM protein [Geoanaerobacter pelophilus]